MLALRTPTKERWGKEKREKPFVMRKVDEGAEISSSVASVDVGALIRRLKDFEMEVKGIKDALCRLVNMENGNHQKKILIQELENHREKNIPGSVMIR